MSTELVLPSVFSIAFLSREGDLSPAQQWETDLAKTKMLGTATRACRNGFYWWVGELFSRASDPENEYYGDVFAGEDASSVRKFSRLLSVDKMRVSRSKRIRDSYSLEEIEKLGSLTLEVLILGARLSEEERMDILRQLLARKINENFTDKEISQILQAELDEREGTSSEASGGSSEEKIVEFKDIEKAAVSFIILMQRYYYACASAETIPEPEEEERLTGLFASLFSEMERISEILSIEESEEGVSEQEEIQ